MSLPDPVVDITRALELARLSLELQKRQPAGPFGTRDGHVFKLDQLRTVLAWTRDPSRFVSFEDRPVLDELAEWIAHALVALPAVSEHLLHEHEKAAGRAVSARFLGLEVFPSPTIPPGRIYVSLADWREALGFEAAVDGPKLSPAEVRFPPVSTPPDSPESPPA